MTDPERWLTDRSIDAGLRSALESASEPPPLPPELHAKLTTYAAGLASSGALAKVAGASWWHRLLLNSGSSKALVLGALIGAVGVGTFGAFYVLVPPPPEGLPAASRATSVAPTPKATSRQPLPTPSAMPSPPLALPDRAVRPQVSTSAVGLGDGTGHLAPVAGAGAIGSASSIADEAKLLERARSLLADAPALAFELTEQHRRLGPTAQLSAEREFIAIEALLRLGRRIEAERRAAPRLEQAPDSVYARRLRGLFAASLPATKTTNP
jgi:hypothetical protein